MSKPRSSTPQGDTIEEKATPFSLNSRKALVRYQPFRKIYGEMRFSREFPKQNKSFLEIPAEIRIKIYRNALRLDEPLELWAFSQIKSEYWLRVVNKKELLRLIRKCDLNLSFLRTCRLVHNEASEVFYGENEFRFTAINGHMVANLFIRKIYKQHFQYIKELTVSMALYISDSHHPRQTKWRRYNDNVPQLLASNWEDKYFDYEEAWKHLAWNMKRMERLRKLTMVIPDNQTGFDFSVNAGLFDEIHSLVSAKPGMAIVMVRLRSRRYGDDREEDDEGEYDDVQTETEWWADHWCPHHIVMRKIKDMAPNCTIKAAAELQHGSWQIMDEVPESVLLPEVEDTDSETDDED